MKQLTPLAISALLLLTACGQTESAPDNQTALPPPAMQEERQAMYADTQMQSILIKSLWLINIIALAEINMAAGYKSVPFLPGKFLFSPF